MKKKSLFWLTLILAMGLFASTSAFAQNGNNNGQNGNNNGQNGNNNDNNGHHAKVPEPASIVLLGVGLLGAGALRRRKLGK